MRYSLSSNSMGRPGAPGCPPHRLEFGDGYKPCARSLLIRVSPNNHQQAQRSLSEHKRLCAVLLQSVSIQFNAQPGFVG